MTNPLFPDDRPYSYGHKSKYPGMSPKDVLVWDAFIRDWPAFTNECYYNFRVGEGVTINTEFEPAIVKMAKSISQLRIDVITVHEEYIRVIELKPYGSCTAIGQLVAYDHLIRQKFANIPDVIPTLICFVCPPDIRNTIDSLDFKVFTPDIPEHVQL